ncbi:MAG: hypothetical protein AB8B55_12535 [Mariniblastus sp.]
MSNSLTRFVLTLSVMAAVTVYCTQDSNAQRRGFRIGSVVQAGGGQGFRLGGQRAGMHFGGGQGASIGGQNFGMRFGNGQGARFGVRNFGMQFGGQQGTQIGRIGTTPGVAPGTYYYGDVRNPVYGQPVLGQPMIVQGTVQPLQPLQPTIATTEQAQPGNGTNVVTAGEAESVTMNAGTVDPQSDIARASLTMEANTANGTPNSAGETILSNSSSDPKKGQIVLNFPADAVENFKYKVNGSDLTIQPGETVSMGAGQDWNIEFDAGGKFGERVATLSEPGEFAFEKTEAEGWVLVEKPATVAKPESTFTNETSVVAPADPTAAPTKETDTPKVETPSVVVPPTETSPAVEPTVEPAKTIVAPVEGTTTEAGELPTEAGVEPVKAANEAAPATPAIGDDSGN